MFQISFDIIRTNIKEYRDKLNLSQEDLAKKVGVSLETIRKIENAELDPPLNLGYRIGEALNSSIPELFIFEKRKSM